MLDTIAPIVKLALTEGAKLPGSISVTLYDQISGIEINHIDGMDFPQHDPKSRKVTLVLDSKRIPKGGNKKLLLLNMEGKYN
ncbi:hypothetical protein MASR1M46_19530 [Bacteroidales bacterium]